MGRLAGGTRFLVDKLAHASLIDAIRGTREAFRVFPHNHLPKLRRLLEQSPRGNCRLSSPNPSSAWTAMQRIFADGRFRQEFGFLLILDEAHASGVYGTNGSGLAAELNLSNSVDVSVVTLSKALGGIGGAVCGSNRFCQFLINHSPRTSSPPAFPRVPRLWQQGRLNCWGRHLAGSGFGIWRRTSGKKLRKWGLRLRPAIRHHSDYSRERRGRFGCGRSPSADGCAGGCHSASDRTSRRKPAANHALMPTQR